MAPVQEMLKETGFSTQIQHLVEALRTFRRTFLEKTSVKGRCILPEKLARIFGPAWSGYGNIEIRYGGKSIHSNDPYECIFQKSDGSWAGWNLNDVVTLEDYERLIFSCWSYTDGQALDVNDSDELCMISWGIKLEVCSALERKAQDIDMLLIPLSRINSYKEYVKKISNIIRNGNSEWMPYRVHWTYIKELDEVINELELADEQYSADTEQEEISNKLAQAIPYEYQTSPMSQTELAEFWGGDMTQKKIRQMIDTGCLNIDQIGRQKFMFDMRQLPPHVKRKLAELN